MATCSKCGTPVSDGSTFCGACGAPVSSVSVPPPPDSGVAPSAGISSNVAAALSYLVGFITGLIFLVLEPYKKDAFVRFHAFQSIFFNVACLIVMILWNILTGMMFFAGGYLGVLFGFVGSLLGLAIFIFWIFLMYKAFNKERYMIPVVGEMAAKQAAKEI